MEHQKQLRYPAWEMSFSEYGKKMGWELPDIGGNFIPDRVEANEERYSERDAYEDARLESHIEAQEEYEDQQEAWNE